MNTRASVGYGLLAATLAVGTAGQMFGAITVVERNPQGSGYVIHVPPQPGWRHTGNKPHSLGSLPDDFRRKVVVDVPHLRASQVGKALRTIA